MCGIFGSTDFERFKTLYSLNQDRGTFSLGAMLYSEEGFCSIREPGIVDVDHYKHGFSHYLGHTQAPTSSQREFTEDTTHPFSAGDWSVAHNGVLANDREIVSKFDFHNVNEVDSSVIPALMDHYEVVTGNTEKDEEAAILEALEELEGTFSCWIVNRKSENLYIARVGSTLFLNSKTGDFSSRKFENSKTVPEGFLYKYNQEYCVFEPVSPFIYNSPYLIL
jgi:glucosamine 6-phosphate synthetase-like amidotransferase/phosphosugar isomerase protein